MQNPVSKVSDILELKGKNAPIHTVPPDAAVFDAVAEMNRQHVGAAVVMKDARVIGIFTERDVLVRVVGGDRDPHKTTVDQVMTPAPHCVTRSMLAKDVMAIATNKRFRHFPVVENDELVGLISIGDLVHFDTTDLESRLNDAILAVKTVTGR